MASWRRKVLTWFPDLRSEAERPDFTAYSAFLELRPRVAEAHLAGDTGTLRRIYGFAERCARQKDKDLWNAAGMAFYERLFDSHRSLWPEFVHMAIPTGNRGLHGLVGVSVVGGRRGRGAAAHRRAPQSPPPRGPRPHHLTRPARCDSIYNSPTSRNCLPLRGIFFPQGGRAFSFDLIFFRPAWMPGCSKNATTLFW